MRDTGLCTAELEFSWVKNSCGLYSSLELVHWISNQWAEAMNLNLLHIFRQFSVRSNNLWFQLKFSVYYFTVGLHLSLFFSPARNGKVILLQRFHERTTITKWKAFLAEGTISKVLISFKQIKLIYKKDIQYNCLTVRESQIFWDRWQLNSAYIHMEINGWIFTEIPACLIVH